MVDLADLYFGLNKNFENVLEYLCANAVHQCIFNNVDGRRHWLIRVEYEFLVKAAQPKSSVVNTLLNRPGTLFIGDLYTLFSTVISIYWADAKTDFNIRNFKKWNKMEEFSYFCLKITNRKTWGNHIKKSFFDLDD